MPDKPPMKTRQNLDSAAGVGSVDAEVKAQIEVRQVRQAEADAAAQAAAQAEADAAALAKRLARPKATYDLPLRLIAAVQDIADKESAPCSDLVRWALADFVMRYREGKIKLTDFRRPNLKSLKYNFKIDPPGKWE